MTTRRTLLWGWNHKSLWIECNHGEDVWLMHPLQQTRHEKALDKSGFIVWIPSLYPAEQKVRPTGLLNQLCKPSIAKKANHQSQVVTVTWKCYQSTNWRQIKYNMHMVVIMKCRFLVLGDENTMAMNFLLKEWKYGCVQTSRRHLTKSLEKLFKVASGKTVVQGSSKYDRLTGIYVEFILPMTWRSSVYMFSKQQGHEVYLLQSKMVQYRYPILPVAIIMI